MRKLGILIIFSFGMNVIAQNIVSTNAYSWHGDTISQGKFKAWAENDYHIISTYHAQPGYFMPVEQEWKKKNDLSKYPQLTSSNRLHNAIYNMGLDEMVNNVEPDTTLRTGKEWSGVWTRDVSYSIILSMAYLQPEASKISLMKKANSNGCIIQDTGSGGAWPVSSDRMIWSVAAYELYKVTGDVDWLKYIYPIIEKSISDDIKTLYGESGLVRGETSFIDWREQSYPKWMQTVDIYNSESLSTSVIHYESFKILAEIAHLLGNKKDSKKYVSFAGKIRTAIDEYLWLNDKGYYAMYRYGRNNLITNPRVETLGESLAILFGVASLERGVSITENNPITPYGVGFFYPQIKDMTSYHNNSLWPFVASYWAWANAKVKNEEGTLQAIGSVFRPAALFATNKENFNLDNGDIATELNSSNMLWSLSGNLAITYRILFGINFETNGLKFQPFIPKLLSDCRSLKNFRYRNAILNITVEGHGDKIKSFIVNGKETQPFISDDSKGLLNVHIIMENNDISPMKVTMASNLKAPLTPISRLVQLKNSLYMEWNPIEYITGYKVLKDGKVIAETSCTNYRIDGYGEYQVIGFDRNGTESFASEPIMYYPKQIVDFETENVNMKSAEISYMPTQDVVGYFGNGFVETDHLSGDANVEFTVPEDGNYLLSVRYANGNGSITTENKAAIRTLKVDGVKAGVIVMPQRGVGNWNDWGNSNYVHIMLTKGKHNLCFSLQPENENMNIHTNHALIDAVIIMKE